MIYLRLALTFLWLVLSCSVGLLWAVVRWGNLNLDRDFARIFSWGVLRVMGLRVEVEGAEHLTSAQPCIYVANHQSGLDMATFGKIYPRRTIVIGKKELKWIPFFGIFFMASGNIMINRQKRVRAIAGLDQAVEALRGKGLSIWIFPEGTRNRSAEPMLPFKKGAFYMAIQAQVPIVPILSSPLGRLISWKDKRVTSGTVRVRALEPIPTTGMTDGDVEKLMAETRRRMNEALRGLST